MKTYLLSSLLLLIPIIALAQPEVPVENWQGKTILLIGAHPDDDAGRHGTLAMLQANGNDVHILLMTSGNVGTFDRNMTRTKLAKIRRAEQIAAMAELGIPESNYHNLGYTDGMLEFADKEEVVRRLVKKIRELKPDVLFAFEPGWGYQKWHKTDHRSAAYLAVDAARAAEWFLIFPEQIEQDGLEAHSINEYMFWGSEGANTTVDISDYVENKIMSRSKHISQFTSMRDNYISSNIEDLPEGEAEAFMQRLRDRTGSEEYYRYYSGAPDGAGSKRN
jgi:LmbE family N-acetylglucosaminyl deacetylase